MTCLNCESPNITLVCEDDDLFCCEECCRFYMKTQRNETMDNIIRSSKKMIQDLKLPKTSLLNPYYNFHMKMIRMLQCRILVANQFKIGNLELIRSMRMKYVGVLGEVTEECNELVKNGVDEQFYIDVCDSMKKSLNMFDGIISSMK